MSTHTISQLTGREVLDSRGNPTVEVELSLSDGSRARAIVPSGASKGAHEALELRDKDPKRFLGKGTLKACENIKTVIAKAVVGKSFESVQALDQLTLALDGTNQKSKLGANALLGVSLAYINAVAIAEKRPLFLVMNEMMGLSEKALTMPVPLMNILNGGVHANNGLEIQEFMIVPHGFPTFREALRAGCEVFQHLKEKLHDAHYSTGVGDEGGFAPQLKSNQEALEWICRAVEAAGYELGREIALALDVASSSFYVKDSGKYALRYQGNTEITKDQMIQFYGELFEKFPIVSVEDGLDEDDWAGWKSLTSKFGEKVQLVGDDLFVTQVEKVKRGISEHIANAVLIKVNQVGTLKETFETMALCREAKYRAVTSHRSGETEDVSIAHLAVGSGCGQIKTGSASRGERTAKYNELLRIEEWAKTNGKQIPFARVFS